MKKTDKDYTFSELFEQGALYDAYNFLGCRFDEKSGEAVFRVWAPRAVSVFVIGDFNGWDKNKHTMSRLGGSGIWEARIQNVNIYDAYKYLISDGIKEFYKSDPYAFFSETHYKTNSLVFPLDKVKINDDEYLRERSKKDIHSCPVNIYEANIGSWKKNADGSLYNYRQFADEITPYLLEMSYTHLELIGVAEYPYDDSWGYQVTGYYAPTSRYGTPDDFAYLVEKLHKNNLGIIIDWVPGHFPKNENGLIEFDGGTLYEPDDPIMNEHKEWGTRTFDYAKPQVKSFLISNAAFWFDVYHADGLRVDAVSSILYLDYDRREWVPNIYGGNGNLHAMDFFQRLNAEIFARFGNVMMIAEESTAWPDVTKPVKSGGLGFNFKWNMGWMNDNLNYIKTEPRYRCHHHNKLTFTMTYAFSENYVLPISHDELVHGKGSLIGKMPGSYDEKFAGLRNFLMNMYAHPGKKLLFMGSEFAVFDEWSSAKSLYWDILEYPKHKETRDFTAALNSIYKTCGCLYEIENSWDGFRWLIVNDKNTNIIAYERLDKSGNSMLCVFNFSPVSRHGYRFGVEGGEYKSVLYSDVSGWNTEEKIYKTENKSSGKFKTSLVLDINGYSGIYLYKNLSS